jgi:GNAT superfamily N-acetyltransferase
MYIIKIEYATPAFDELSKFKYLELMEPAGLDWDENLLADDEVKHHFGIYDSNFNLLGAVKFDTINNRAELEDIFVHKNFRNQGLGASLLNKSIEQLKSMGFEEIGCSDQNDINGFLVKSGFEKKNEKDYFRKI